MLETVTSFPDTWMIVKLGEISEKINPGFPSGKWKRDGDGGVPHLRPMNITQHGDIDLENLKYAFRDGYDSLKKYDILFNNTNSPVLLGKTSYIKRDTDWAYSNHMTRIRFNNSLVHSPFFSYHLHYQFYNGYYRMNCRHHVNQASINSTFLRNMEVPLPPYNEQVRIISKIEELFSRLDQGAKELLKTIQIIEEYKQSMIKEAFTGKLTRKWRLNNPEETSRKLLSKINEYWREKNTPKPRKQVEVNYENLPTIPSNWLWVSINDVSRKLQYGSSSKATLDTSGIPVLRMGNIQDGQLTFSDLKYYDENSSEIDDLILEEGDLLFNRTNSAELVGKTAVYYDHYPKAVFASYLIRVKLLKDYIYPEIVSEYINSVLGKRYISKVRSQQVGQANVNGTKLAAMPIPLIPKNEQLIIKDIFNTNKIRLSRIKKSLKQSLDQTTLTIQSVLKRAFTGGLVPQDPTDEPASVLLERIKSEKSKLKPIQKRGRKRRSNN